MSQKSCGSCGEHSSCNTQEKEQDLKLQQSMGRIKHKLVILSGKGGVGKSSVAANLAVGLALSGYKVGLMDVDVHGPSIPRLLSLGEAKIQAAEQKLMPVQWNANLSVISLGFFLPSKEDAVIWRGPIKMSLIRQFLQDVDWGDLDYLLIDCPPGTGDEPISVLQLLDGQASAIVVTSPQVLAIDDVRRSIQFCHHTGNPVMGIVENMSGFVCPYCRQEVDIFNSGGGEALAREMNVPFLGRIPLDPGMVNAADQGLPYLQSHVDDPAAQALEKILEPIRDLEKQGRRQAAAQENPEQQRTGSAQGPQQGGKKEMKIAIPVAQGRLCQHFGHCEQFALVSVDTEAKKIQAIEHLNPPPHEPGVLPRWLAEQKADLVIVGGMGSRAQGIFQEHGVQVLAGAQGGSPEEIVVDYLNSNLVTGANACDH
ncbi:MAG: iron-sulfur cluster carrier protein MrpORP [Desulfohalobiaceae bacterium]